MRGHLRKEDVFGRLGGEEFGILLRYEGADPTEAVANRLRESIATLAFPTLPELRITASFGIDDLSEAAESPESWMKRADTALYAAKQSGRNRCVVAEATDLVAAD